MREDWLQNLVNNVVGVSIGEGMWYFSMAFGAWLAFYVVFNAALGHRRVSRDDPTAGQISREILHSMRSIVIFGLVWAIAVLIARELGIRMFRGRDASGVWFVTSIALAIVIHDTYFYWTHRAMHHRRLYRFFHSTHHLSTSPTPWAAYAFSPAEAAVQAFIGPLVVFLLPLHPGAMGIFMMWQITFNVMGHCGYEIYPRWFLASPLGKFVNSVTHHALHHEKFKANYSLYFNVWDRLMATNHRDYEQRFELATGPRSQA
jgi:lathosterol oxidase